MSTATTNDIKISVETSYQNGKIPNADGDHMFAYRVTISNQSDHTIKLLRRHWFIIDSVFGKNEIEGEGVIGLQPIIEPGESHQYVSGCALKSDIGKMYGNYLFEKQFDGKLFRVRIPEFKLIAPFRFN